ncbi:MAG TPA: hypothetical protein DEQ02_07615 [Ruminococcaceae bacterium]|nr:hypothetical protein [Oscillospiraceae bacterium]
MKIPMLGAEPLIRNRWELWQNCPYEEVVPRHTKQKPAKQRVLCRIKLYHSCRINMPIRNNCDKPKNSVFTGVERFIAAAFYSFSEDKAVPNPSMQQLDFRFALKNRKDGKSSRSDPQVGDVACWECTSKPSHPTIKLDVKPALRSVELMIVINIMLII